MADYWAVKYAVTGGTSGWQRRCVWVVLAIGVAFNAHSDMREMLTSGLDYPFSLLVTVPISVVLIPIAMAIGRWRFAHMGSGPFSEPPLRFEDRSGEK